MRENTSRQNRHRANVAASWSVVKQRHKTRPFSPADADLPNDQTDIIKKCHNIEITDSRVNKELNCSCPVELEISKILIRRDRLPANELHPLRELPSFREPDAPNLSTSSLQEGAPPEFVIPCVVEMHQQAWHTGRRRLGIWRSPSDNSSIQWAKIHPWAA